jgi:c(7)-type cytochrome triheme protein
MHKNAGLTKFLCAVAFALVFAPLHWASAADDKDYLEEARLHAETAKADAKKAMAEAEAAIAEADAAIAKATAVKHAAKEEKKMAMEKMVEAQYFPADIDMTTLDGVTTAVFSHKKHTEREQLRCIECHPRVFKMKVGDSVVKGSNLTMKEMQKGSFCGNCHDGEKAFDVTSIEHCQKCHPGSKQ